MFVDSGGNIVHLTGTSLIKKRAIMGRWRLRPVNEIAAFIEFTKI
jgi:hypothetical protein